MALMMSRGDKLPSCLALLANCQPAVGDLNDNDIHMAIGAASVAKIILTLQVLLVSDDV